MTSSLIAARDELPAPRLHQTQRLWLPGDFASSNAMMESLRAEGFNAGLRHYERMRARRQSPVNRPHARLVASIRQQAAMQARRHLHPVPAEHWVRLAFFLMGHPRYDADAWYAVAKPIADGLQDAGIIGRDGADVHSTEGRCVRSVEEARAILASIPEAAPGMEYMAGMLVQVSPWG